MHGFFVALWEVSEVDGWREEEDKTELMNVPDTEAGG